MSAFPPPNVYFNGIIYDSDYFTQSSSSGLSVAQANALYLRKTVTDTATALETFNSGIKTDSISSLSTSSNCTLFNDTGAGTLSSTLCSSNNIIKLGEGCKFLNLGYNMPSGDGRYITIGAAASQNTNIAIGGNFANVVSGFNKIYIGQSGKTVNILGTTNNIGSSTSNNYIYNIESPSASTNIDLYSLLADANLTLCNGQGTGSLSLGSGTGRSGGVSIMTNGNAPVVNELLLGDSTKTIRLRGTANINSDVNSNIVLGNSSGTNIILLNRPLTPNYAPSAITSGKIGYSIKYTFAGGLIPALGNATFGSFTNTAVGIYLLTVGTFTVFAFDPIDRLDIAFSVATNITFLSSGTTMEFGGNSLTKMGIGFSIPISITNATNQLTIVGNGSGSDINYTAGASSLLRLA